MGPGDALEGGDRTASPGPYRSPALQEIPGPEAIAAQRIACTALVRSCGDALFDVRCRTGAAAKPAEVRAGLMAAVLLEEILAVWRATLSTLESEQGEGSPTRSFTGRSRPLTTR
jgi:hypothetical protein